MINIFILSAINQTKPLHIDVTVLKLKPFVGRSDFIQSFIFEALCVRWNQLMGGHWVSQKSSLPNGKYKDKEELNFRTEKQNNENKRFYEWMEGSGKMMRMMKKKLKSVIKLSFSIEFHWVFWKWCVQDSFWETEMVTSKRSKGLKVVNVNRGSDRTQLNVWTLHHGKKYTFKM